MLRGIRVSSGDEPGGVLRHLGRRAPSRSSTGGGGTCRTQARRPRGPSLTPSFRMGQTRHASCRTLCWATAPSPSATHGGTTGAPSTRRSPRRRARPAPSRSRRASFRRSGPCAQSPADRWPSSASRATPSPWAPRSSRAAPHDPHAPARSCDLLQGERPLLHVPRPAPHPRDHDDRRRLRHARRSELPRAHDREHGTQHLRRCGPQRQEGRRLKGAGLPRRGHGGVPHRVRPLRQRARLAAGRPPTFTSTSSRPCSPRREPSRAERSCPPGKRHGIRRFPGKPTRRRLEIMAGGIKPRPLDTISDHKRGRGRC